MNYLITENQFRIISEATTGKNFNENMKRLYSFSIKIVSKVEKKYGLNLRLLTTWGPAVGGFVLPFDNFIRNKNFNFTENQIALVLIGIATTIFFDNKPILKKVLSKIKEEGILDTFKEIVERAKDLKYVFIRFMESLSTSINSVSEILSYSFLIPIIGDIQSMLTKNSDIVEASKIIGERLLSSGVVLVGAITLIEVINKILKRLS